MRKTPIKDIHDTLAALEIPRNRVVVVHSSLLKFGLLEGGAAAVVEVLRDVLGPDATLVMPAFTFAFTASRVWHAADSVSEMGALTEYYRKLPETRRSIHPFHSVSASGPLADDIVSGLCPTSFGPDSAYDKMYDHDAINLFIGTEFIGGATFLHMGEERAHVPYRFMKVFPGDVFDESGGRVDMQFEMYVRSMTDEYEYNTDWSAWWDELQEDNCFMVVSYAGAMFCISEIKRTLDLFKHKIESDPFRHSHAYPRNQPH